MRERGLLKLSYLGASRWSAAASFRVGTFSTGTMGNFRPELTQVTGILAVRLIFRRQRRSLRNRARFR